MLKDTSAEFYNHMIVSISTSYDTIIFRAKCGIEFEASIPYINPFIESTEKMQSTRCLKCREGLSRLLISLTDENTQKIRQNFINNEYPFTMK